MLIFFFPENFSIIGYKKRKNLLLAWESKECFQPLCSTKALNIALHILHYLSSATNIFLH